MTGNAGLGLDSNNNAELGNSIHFKSRAYIAGNENISLCDVCSLCIAIGKEIPA